MKTTIIKHQLLVILKELIFRNDSILRIAEDLTLLSQKSETVLSI